MQLCSSNDSVKEEMTSRAGVQLHNTFGSLLPRASAGDSEEAMGGGGRQEKESNWTDTRTARLGNSLADKR